MPSALVPLANVTLSSSASSVTFSSISGLYRDLMLVSKWGAVSGSGSMFIYFNGNTSNYSNVSMAASGSGTSTTNYGANAFGFIYAPLEYSANNALVTTHILDYSATDKQKTTISRSSDSGLSVELIAGRWANTAAVTSITIAGGGITFAANSSFMLYGISA